MTAFSLEQGQMCRLCDGTGICPFDAHARCPRCKGVGRLVLEIDQSKPLYVLAGCGRCGGTHLVEDTLYVAPCPEASEHQQPMTARAHRD